MFIFNYIKSAAITLLFFSSAFGCSYIGYPDPPVNYIAAKTGTIFIGRVISTSSSIQTQDDYKYQRYKIKFKVEKVLKGGGGKIQEITVDKQITGRTSCTVDPPEFLRGDIWLIHGDLKPARYLFGGSSFEQYKRLLKNNRNYVEKLETAIRNQVNALTGHIQEAESLDPTQLNQSVEVVVKGNGVELSTKTNKNGFYSFENIPDGNYKIQIRLTYRTRDFMESGYTSFDPQTNTHNFTYEVSIRNGDVDYRLTVVNDPPIK